MWYHFKTQPLGHVPHRHTKIYLAHSFLSPLSCLHSRHSSDTALILDGFHPSDTCSHSLLDGESFRTAPPKMSLTVACKMCTGLMGTDSCLTGRGGSCLYRVSPPLPKSYTSYIALCLQGKGPCPSKTRQGASCRVGLLALKRTWLWTALSSHGANSSTDFVTTKLFLKAYKGSLGKFYLLSLFPTLIEGHPPLAEISAPGFSVDRLCYQADLAPANLHLLSLWVPPLLTSRFWWQKERKK